MIQVNSLPLVHLTGIPGSPVLFLKINRRLFLHGVFRTPDPPSRYSGGLTTLTAYCNAKRYSDKHISLIIQKSFFSDLIIYLIALFAYHERFTPKQPE